MRAGIRWRQREKGAFFLFCFVFFVFFLLPGFKIGLFLCLLFDCLSFHLQRSLTGMGAGFVRRGVVVGGGFRLLRAPRTLRPAGCLEFG